MIEIEIKARVHNFDEIIELLNKARAEFLVTEIHEDIYFNSPNRDFNKTDEALRVRKMEDRCFLVYKGPRIGNKNTKTRKEIEVEITSNPDELIKILDIFDFRKAAVVRKKRDVYKFNDLEICLDDVEGLGKFIEVETLQKDTMDAKSIFDFMEMLGINKEEFITESYLELLGI